MKTPGLMNGLPLVDMGANYVFLSLPPRRLGDEALILDAQGKKRHVIWLRGPSGRKQWLVDVKGLRKMQDAHFRQQFPKQ